MTGYLLPLCCPRCGSPLDHLQSSKPGAGTQASAIARCSGYRCHHEWQVIVHLRPVAGRRPSGAEQRKRAQMKVAS